MAEPALRVVHLDDDLAVVDKPAGLVVHPAPSHTGPTLVDELGRDPRRRRDPERPGIVHRLDKGTSGLLVVARDRRGPGGAAGGRCASARSSGVYLALAGGRLGSRTGTIDAPIGRAWRSAAPDGGLRRRLAPGPDPFRGAGAAAARELRRGKLETGRTHQIRAHFAAIGHPLTGDSTYGGAERYGLERQFLHAHRLAFRHPLSGEPPQLHLAAAGGSRRAPWRPPAPRRRAALQSRLRKLNPRSGRTGSCPAQRSAGSRQAERELHHKPRRIECPKQA